MAAAHTELIGSTPTDGTSVPSRPQAVELTFSDPLQTGFTTVVLNDDAGRQVPTQPPTVTGNSVSLPFPTDAPGEYAVAYRVLSQDGHSVSGAIRFTVQQSTAAQNSLPSAPGQSSPETSTPGPATPDDNASTQAAWWLGGMAVAVLLLGGAVFVALRRRPDEKSDE
ncbi:copper resistance CopC family protein [Saccharopolyspora tripterygii]